MGLKIISTTILCDEKDALLITNMLRSGPTSLIGLANLSLDVRDITEADRELIQEHVPADILEEYNEEVERKKASEEEGSEGAEGNAKGETGAEEE